MSIDETITYKQLENLYTACISTAIKTTLNTVWADESEGPFGKFVFYDQRNTDRTNKKKKDDQSKVHNITANCDSFEAFDFQACNRTLHFLGDVYTEIYEFYKIPTESRKLCTNIANKMLSLRNILAHLKASEDPTQIEKVENEILNYINIVFSLGFNVVKDDDGNSFYDRFKAGYLAYTKQQMLQWVKLDDYLDRRKYDYSRFLDVCVSNNIRVKMEDGFYWFCSSDIDSTVAILKNNLSYANKKFEVPKKAENRSVSNFPYIVFAIIIAIIILFSIIASSILGGFKNIFKDIGKAPSVPKQTEQVTPSPSPYTTPDASATPTASSSKNTSETTNQILPEHQNNVLSLKYSSSLALQTNTLHVQAGSFVSPPCASTWSDIKIYSEDTRIAIGEGSLIKGVSKGTTFVVAQSTLGTVIVYCIIVD